MKLTAVADLPLKLSLSCCSSWCPWASASNPIRGISLPCETKLHELEISWKKRLKKWDEIHLWTSFLAKKKNPNFSSRTQNSTVGCSRNPGFASYEGRLLTGEFHFMPGHGLDISKFDHRQLQTILFFSWFFRLQLDKNRMQIVSKTEGLRLSSCRGTRAKMTKIPAALGCAFYTTTSWQRVTWHLGFIGEISCLPFCRLNIGFMIQLWFTRNFAMRSFPKPAVKNIETMVYWKIEDLPNVKRCQISTFQSFKQFECCFCCESFQFLVLKKGPFQALPPPCHRPLFFLNLPMTNSSWSSVGREGDTCSGPLPCGNIYVNTDVAFPTLY